MTDTMLPVTSSQQQSAAAVLFAKANVAFAAVYVTLLIHIAKYTISSVTESLTDPVPNICRRSV